MQELQVEKEENAELIRKDLQRVFEELGGKSESILKGFVQQKGRKLCGEYTGTLRALPCEEGDNYEVCKLYLLNDVVLISFDRKRLRKSPTIKFGIIDAPTFQGALEIKKGSTLPRFKKLPASQLVYYFDLRRLHVKTFQSANKVQLRYVLRSKETGKDGTRKHTTRIATLDLLLDQGKAAFEEAIEMCINKLDSASPSGGLSSTMRRTWNRKLSTSTVPRRRQVMNERRSRDGKSTSVAGIRVATLERKASLLAAARGTRVVMDGPPEEDRFVSDNNKNSEEEGQGQSSLRLSTARMLATLRRISSQRRSVPSYDSSALEQRKSILRTLEKQQIPISAIPEDAPPEL